MRYGVVVQPKRKFMDKFCKDCKWMTEASPVCGHEKGQSGIAEYLVFGETRLIQHFSCVSMRSGVCGTEGIYWEHQDGMQPVDLAIEKWKRRK